jgi:hypothetical protein
MGMRSDSHAHFYLLHVTDRPPSLRSFLKILSPGAPNGIKFRLLHDNELKISQKLSSSAWKVDGNWLFSVKGLPLLKKV